MACGHGNCQTCAGYAAFYARLFRNFSDAAKKRVINHRRRQHLVQFKKGKQKMKNVFKFFALSAVLTCFALFAGSVFAQTSTTGSIEGTVTDPNGAAVPGITVKVTSPNLISPQTATTDNNGRYKVLNLPPGRYTVTIEAEKGFEKAERTDVEVNLSRTSTSDVQMKIAGTQASVTVTDTA